MADLIEQEQVRELVRKTEVATVGGDHAGAMIALSDAFDLLQLPRRSGSSRPSPLRFGESIGLAATSLKHRVNQALQPPRDSRGIDIHGFDREFVVEHITSLTNIVRELQEAARVTTLGIDYAAYLKFSRLTPIHSDNIQGVRQYRAPKGYAPTSHDVEFCHQQ